MCWYHPLFHGYHSMFKWHSAMVITILNTTIINNQAALSIRQKSTCSCALGTLEDTNVVNFVNKGM